MNALQTTLVALAIGGPLLAQDAVLRDLAEQARIGAEDARKQAESMKLDLAQQGIDLAKGAADLKFNFDFSGLDKLDFGGLDKLKGDLAFLQQNPMPSPGAKVVYRNSASYDQGTRYLDNHQYDQAIEVFDRLIAAKADRTEAAFYWKAYALNRLGRGDDALASLAALRRDYPSSRWLGDAQVLEAEVKQNAGHPVSPDAGTNDDIKLMAINSLMNADPERAIPLLENLLKGASSIRLKERVLFVLTQSKSPKAEQILTDYAKGAGNPDLQIRAIRYIGQTGTPESQQRLANIYTTSTDTAVKTEIIRSLQGSGAFEKLLELARTEKDPSLKLSLIQNLAFAKGATPEALTSMYSSDSDVKVKRALVDGLFSRRDAKPLVELARKESDLSMKKYIVDHLANMRNSKEATDYMLELLK
jgi:tetratricopeptide (TPR) repeat protein